MSSPGDAWVSLSDHTLQISVEGPVGWSRGTADAFPLQLRAPEEDHFRATCGFSHERFEPPTPEGLATFVTRTAQAQRDDYPGYRRTGHEDLVVDNRPGIIEEYGWEPSGFGRRLCQLLALFVVSPGLLLEIDAACLEDHAERYLAMFRRIIGSVRVLG